MGLRDMLKKIFKNPKGKAPPAGSGTAVEATPPPRKTDAEIPSVKAPKALGVKVWSPGVSPIVDIVFVHGLTGNWEKTWTANKETEPWPKALLATDITNARIVTYGYDADIVHWMKPAGQNTVREHAQNLVNDLCSLRARTKTPKLPIIFVAHSLGGLVCQDALLLCVNPNEEAQKTLLDCTRGVAFMGTPNAGSDFEKFATAVANIINLSFVKAPTTQLLEVLKQRSQVLANIKSGFFTMVRRRITESHPEIKIHAFVEELPISATGHRVVTPDSAIIPGYNSTTIPANHMNMTKFSDKGNIGYERILGRLMDWISGIEDTNGRIKTAVIGQNTANDSSLQEVMSDIKLGNSNYYRYPKRASKFIQRPGLISEITSLITQKSEATPRVCILCGMGGQGKTALAVDFCRQAEARHLFLAIFWTDASTEETLMKSLIAISDVVKRSADQTFASNDERITFTLQTMESWNRPWLLIFDNYDNPDRFQNLGRYMPASPQGSILITSRNSNLARLGTVIEVPAMSPNEALALLYDRVGGAEKFPEQEEDAAKIVNLLGYLPLAIDQAGAYIQRRVNFPLSRFIDEYEDRKDLIWTKAPTVWEYKKVVYTTWEMSFELIDDDENERIDKGQILTMLSFLDFRNISQEIFKIPRRLAIASVEHAVDPPKWLRLLLNETGEWDWSKLEDLFLDFRDLSLIQLLPLGPGTLRLSMHPLVSEWIKHRADSNTKRECLLQAIAIVNMCLHSRLLAVERPLLSAETEQQFFRHKFSCTENLRELQKKDDTFLSNLHPFPGPENPENSENVTETIKVEAQRTRKAIKEIQDDLSQVSNQVQTLLDDQELQYERAILEWISPESLSSFRTSELLSGHLSMCTMESSAWFINHPIFQGWVQGKPQELWCYGAAGSGKTIIASQAAKFISQSISSSMVLLVYGNFRYREQQTIKNILGNLLRQVIQQKAINRGIIEDCFGRGLDTAPKLSKITNLLFDTFRHSKRSIYIIVDGFDELPPKSRGIIDVLRNESAKLKIMVTSRNLPELDVHRQGFNAPVIEIKPEVEDMLFFVRTSLINNARLARFIRNDPALKQKIEESIVKKSMGVLVFAKILIEQLSLNATRRDLYRDLQELPDSLEASYETSLRRISIQRPSEAKVGNMVLMWLTFSYRPMSQRELQQAIAVIIMEPTEMISHEDPFFKTEYSLFTTEDISQVCVGLVTKDETDMIRLSHASLHEYLNRIKGQRFPEAQVQITECCLKFLSRKPFASGPCLETTLRDRILEYPFALYAAEFWMLHAKENERNHIEQIVDFLTAKTTYKSWIQILKYIEESASEDISAQELQGTVASQTLSARLAACKTPLQAAKVLDLDLVATTLAERDRGKREGLALKEGS